MISPENAPSHISHLIYATEVFSHGWNDPAEILPDSSSIILDVIQDCEVPEDRFHAWNKFYYENLCTFYSLGEEQLESISSIINVDKDKHRELYLHWPATIDSETYHKLHNTLKIDFVSRRETDSLKGQYAIILNSTFWDVIRTRSRLLTDIIHTHERHFEDFELIHNSYDDALEYGIIIYDRLCMTGRTETLYFYHEILREKSGTADTLPEFNFDIRLYKVEDKKAEYDRIRKKQANDIKLMCDIINKLDCRPFEVVRL